MFSPINRITFSPVLRHVQTQELNHALPSVSSPVMAPRRHHRPAAGGARGPAALLVNTQLNPHRHQLLPHHPPSLLPTSTATPTGIFLLTRDTNGIICILQILVPGVLDYCRQVRCSPAACHRMPLVTPRADTTGSPVCAVQAPSLG